MRTGRALALLWLAAVGGLQAQSVVELSFEGAVQQALRTNPELAVADAQTDMQRGLVRQAGLRPNPRLTVQTEDIRTSTQQDPFSFVNSTEDYLLLAQTVETAGKRGRRLDVAKGNVETSELQARLLRRQLVQRVSAAYWNAVLAERIAQLGEQTLETYTQDVNYIQARVREGVAAESDLLRTQVERDRLQVQALTARRDRDQSIISLQRTIGATTFPEVRLTTPLESKDLPAIPAIEDVLTARPEMAIARQQVATAESNVRLQRATGVPDPQVSGGYKRNIGLDTAYAAVQIELPFLNRNQGNVGSALAQVRREEANVRVQTAAIRAEYEAALRLYQSQRELVEKLPPVVRQAGDAEDRARQAYREGGLELLRFLDARRSHIQVEVDYARALADLQQSIAGLRAASGADVTGVAAQ